MSLFVVVAPEVPFCVWTVLHVSGQPYSFICLRLYLPLLLYYNISLIILTKLHIILRRLVEVDFYLSALC